MKITKKQKQVGFIMAALIVVGVIVYKKKNQNKDWKKDNPQEA